MSGDKFVIVLVTQKEEGKQTPAVMRTRTLGVFHPNQEQLRRVLKLLNDCRYTKMPS